jgi:uncharacterized membrane protein YqjE
MPEPTPPTPDATEKSVGELVVEVSEKTSLLIREEIELAKTEVTEKVTKLIQGSVVGIVAGVFAFLALILLMHGFAWLLNDLVFGDSTWIGFLVEAGLFLIAAAAAGYFAYRSIQKGAPPVPEMAIEEARRTRATLERGES